MTRKFEGNELVIATHNRGKMEEFRHLFGGRGITFYTAEDFGLPSPEETGTTFVENARIKALFAAQGSGKPALADDSGLCVHALGGAPGVYTADWAGPERDFTLAMTTVNDKLGDAADRSAHFVSVIMLAWPDGHVEYVEGEAHGRLVWPMRGQLGHGFDPVFVPDGHDLTYAEMPAAQKNAISHRSIAFAKMMDKCFR